MAPSEVYSDNDGSHIYIKFEFDPDLSYKSTLKNLVDVWLALNSFTLR